MTPEERTLDLGPLTHENSLTFQLAVSNPIALAVPSVIVPASNVVLFPQARAFWDLVSLKALALFDYDPRLFPEPSPDQLPEQL